MKTDQFRREKFSKALISTDREALEAYKTRRGRAKKMEELEADINNIRKDMSEIKTLLQQILHRG